MIKITQKRYILIAIGLIVLIMFIAAVVINSNKKAKISEEYDNCYKYLIHAEEQILIRENKNNSYSEKIKLCNERLKKIEDLSPILVKQLPDLNTGKGPYHKTLKLKNGNVLIWDSGVSYFSKTTIELFEPIKNTFTPLKININFNNLYSFDSIELKNGKILIQNIIYDPQKNIFEKVDKNIQNILDTYFLNKDWIKKGYGIVNITPDGKILYRTNCKFKDGNNCVKLIDPFNDNKYLEGVLNTKIDPFYSIFLKNGKILIIGQNKRVELYNPKTGNIKNIGEIKNSIYRGDIVVLDDGQVLFWESCPYENKKYYIEIYDPDTNKINMFDTPYNLIIANKLFTLPGTGCVLLIGNKAALLYNIEEKKYYKLTNKIFKFEGQVFTPLNNGQILVTGGKPFDKKHQSMSNKAFIISFKKNYKDYLYSINNNTDYFNLILNRMRK